MRLHYGVIYGVIIFFNVVEIGTIWYLTVVY